MVFRRKEGDSHNEDEEDEGEGEGEIERQRGTRAGREGMRERQASGERLLARVGSSEKQEEGKRLSGWEGFARIMDKIAPKYVFKSSPYLIPLIPSPHSYITPLITFCPGTTPLQTLPRPRPPLHLPLHLRQLLPLLLPRYMQGLHPITMVGGDDRRGSGMVLTGGGGGRCGGSGDCGTGDVG